MQHKSNNFILLDDEYNLKYYKNPSLLSNKKSIVAIEEPIIKLKGDITSSKSKCPFDSYLKGHLKTEEYIDKIIILLNTVESWCPTTKIMYNINKLKLARNKIKNYKINIQDKVDLSIVLFDMYDKCHSKIKKLYKQLSKYEQASSILEEYKCYIDKIQDNYQKNVHYYSHDVILAQTVYS